MPCHSDYNGGVDYNGGGAHHPFGDRVAIVMDELDLVTRLLCGLMRWMEQQGYTTHDPDLDAELAVWWERHKAFDASENRGKES